MCFIWRWILWVSKYVVCFTYIHVAECSQPTCFPIVFTRLCFCIWHSGLFCLDTPSNSFIMLHLSKVSSFLYYPISWDRIKSRLHIVNERRDIYPPVMSCLQFVMYKGRMGQINSCHINIHSVGAVKKHCLKLLCTWFAFMCIDVSALGHQCYTVLTSVC